MKRLIERDELEVYALFVAGPGCDGSWCLLGCVNGFYDVRSDRSRVDSAINFVHFDGDGQ
jgi:hypothetical protein